MNEPDLEQRSFEENLDELESIVRRLEAGELPLEQALAAFERGVRLVRHLRGHLDRVEQRIEMLSRDSSGALRLDPVPGDKEAG